MPSADIDLAAKTAVTARTQNAGQSCICAKRMIVHQDVYVPWSRSLKRMMIEDWAKLRDLHPAPLFVMHQPEYGTKHLKFIRLFGFSLLAPYQDHEDNPRELYVSLA